MSSSLEVRLFINNEFREAKSGHTLTIKNPYNLTTVSGDIHSAGAEDVDDTVEAAAVAFQSWRNTPTAVRANYMNKLADLMEKHAEELASLESQAMGMPVAIASLTVQGAASFFRYFAGWTDKVSGETFPDDGDGIYRIVRYEPIGVCAGIASWNATFSFIGWKLAPAIAAGNTFIFKPSEKAPLGALAFARLVQEAGFPPGVINILNGGGVTGGALASHLRISKISFTGSTETGKRVQKAAVESNLKRCTLELGGKSASVVFDDADLETVLSSMSLGFLFNSGQVCAATSRLLVQENIAPRVIQELKMRFENLALTYGDPADSKTLIGPLADEQQFDWVMEYLHLATEEGLEVLTGGARHGDRGLFVQPTIVLNPPLSSDLYRKEIFGPVLCIRTFKAEAEAIELANDSVFGLGAAVFTTSMSRALRVSAMLEAGNVGINQSVIPDRKTPFGGMKESGYGREGGKQGIMAYLEAKSIAINTKAP